MRRGHITPSKSMNNTVTVTVTVPDFRRRWLTVAVAGCHYHYNCQSILSLFGLIGFILYPRPPLLNSNNLRATISSHPRGNIPKSDGSLTPPPAPGEHKGRMTRSKTCKHEGI